MATRKNQYEDSTRYPRPTDEPGQETGAMKWTAAQQADVKRLASNGTLKGGTSEIHWSLDPALDVPQRQTDRHRGLMFTKAMRDVLAEAVAKGGKLPPPHPARPPRLGAESKRHGDGSQVSASIRRQAWVFDEDPVEFEGKIGQFVSFLKNIKDIIRAERIKLAAEDGREIEPEEDWAR